MTPTDEQLEELGRRALVNARAADAFEVYIRALAKRDEDDAKGKVFRNDKVEMARKTLVRMLELAPQPV